MSDVRGSKLASLNSHANFLSINSFLVIIIPTEQFVYARSRLLENRSLMAWVFANVPGNQCGSNSAENVLGNAGVDSISWDIVAAAP